MVVDWKTEPNWDKDFAKSSSCLMHNLFSWRLDILWMIPTVISGRQEPNFPFQKCRRSPFPQFICTTTLGERVTCQRPSSEFLWKNRDWNLSFPESMPTSKEYTKLSLNWVYTCKKEGLSRITGLDGQRNSARA